MSAGTGILHSEYNASSHEVLHLLQIWVIPETAGLLPSYEQKKFSIEERTGTFRLIASRFGQRDSIKIHQDLNLYSAILPPGEVLMDRMPTGRYGWLQVARGALMLNGELIGAGDSAALIHGGAIELETPLEGSTSEILLFDLK
jgi:redox-sensitive bicupin YhaK (pirin superfamily)